MPVDYASVRQQAAQAARRQADEHQRLARLVEQAQRLLHTWAGRQQELHDRVEVALRTIRGWRGAQPALMEEPLTAVHPPPEEPPASVVLAADGSQITPDRHAEVYFGLINIGLVAFAPPHPPVALVRSQLLLGETLYGNGEEGTPGIGLRRDLAERQALAWAVAVLRGHDDIRSRIEEAFPPLRDASPGAGQAERLRALQTTQWVLTLTDGPLELWGARPGEEGGAFSDVLNQYQKTLTFLKELGALPVGYVDKPRADLVIRMLELTLEQSPSPPGPGSAPGVPPQAGSQGTGQALGARPFLGLSDRELMHHLLQQPGQRSTLFRIRSSSLQSYHDDLAPWFFYLNVSVTPESPWVVRVEIPAWVGQDPRAVAVVHAALWRQCRIVPGRQYPYALHRAHETAVVTREDREQVERMLLMALRRLQVQPSARSHKQRMKDDFTRRSGG